MILRMGRSSRSAPRANCQAAGRAGASSTSSTADKSMNNPIEELTARFLKACDAAGESEQRVVERLTQRLHISRNTRQEFEESLTFGQRLADRIAIFGGSWTF